MYKYAVFTVVPIELISILNSYEVNVFTEFVLAPA